jgi:hypothetical protein
MAAKEVVFADEARQRMFKGVNILANAVKATLGPKGRNAILDKSARCPPMRMKASARRLRMRWPRSARKA